MSPRPRLSLESHAAPADVEVVNDGLRAFNIQHIGDSGLQPVHVFLRNGAGAVVGGLLGEIRWGWLYVSKLWIADEHRGQRLGSEMLGAAEEHARAQGCAGVHLDTFDYQARPFYEKLGYELVGTLDGYPAGGRQHYLAKRFSNAPTP